LFCLVIFLVDLLMNISMYAMEAAPGAPSPNPTDLTVEKGGKAGIWQSGMGLASDGNRIFVTTGYACPQK
jgi:iron transport multicopper oxidase